MLRYAGSVRVTQRPKITPPMNTSIAAMKELKEVEHHDRGNADCDEQLALNSHVHQRAVKAFVDAVSAAFFCS